MVNITNPLAQNYGDFQRVRELNAAVNKHALKKHNET